MTETTRDPTGRRARQKAILTWLAVLLVVMGVVVLFLLERMPLPLRLLIGMGDVFAGLVLLIFIRPKFDA